MNSGIGEHYEIHNLPQILKFTLQHAHEVLSLQEHNIHTCI